MRCKSAGMIHRVLKWSAPREQSASTAAPATVPNSPPMPDLSALTAEEIQTLETVLKRQEELEQLEEQREKKLRKMIEEYEINVKHLEQSAATPRGLGCVPVIDLRLCRLCFKTKFADGIGKLCVDCKRRVCSRCGMFCPVLTEMTSGRERWHCHLCQLKRQLLCMTGRWYHGGVSRPTVSVRELLTRIRDVKELDIESDREEGSIQRAIGGHCRLRDIKTDSEDLSEQRPRTIAKRKNRSSRCLQRSVAITDDPEPPTREQIAIERHDSLRELRAKRRSKSDYPKSPTQPVDECSDDVLNRTDNTRESKQGKSGPQFCRGTSQESLATRVFSEIGGDMMLLTSSLNDDLPDIGTRLESPSTSRAERNNVAMGAMRVGSESAQNIRTFSVDRSNDKRPRGPYRYPTISCEEDIHRAAAYNPPLNYVVRTVSSEPPRTQPAATPWRREAKSDTCTPADLQDLHPPGSFEVTLFNDGRSGELRMRDFTAASFGLHVTGGVKTADGRLAAYVTDIREGGPADKADVRPGYIVLLWNGFPLTDLTFEQTKRVIDATRDEKHVTLTLTCPGLSPFQSQSSFWQKLVTGSSINSSRNQLLAPSMTSVAAGPSAESCPNVRRGSLYQSSLTKGDTRSWPLRLPVEPHYLHTPEQAGHNQLGNMRRSGFSSASGVTIMVPSDFIVNPPADMVSGRTDKSEIPTSRSKESLRRSPSPSSQEMWMQRKQERLASRRARSTSDTRAEGSDIGRPGRRRCNTVPGSPLLSGLDFESPSSRKRAGSSSSFVSSSACSEMSLSSLLPSDADSDSELAGPEDDSGGPAQVIWTTKEAESSLGYVNLSLLISKGNLEVSVMCARGISGKGDTNPPDTYIKTYLLEEGRKLHKRKTKVVHQNSDPNYQKKLLYPACDVDNRILQLMVWEKGKGLESNRCVGEVRVDLDRLDLSKKTSGWYKLLPPMTADTGSVESLNMPSH